MMKWLDKLMGRGSARAPTSPLTATLKLEPGNLFVLRIGGVLNKATMDNIQAVARRYIEGGVRNLKVLLLLDEFQGWKSTGDWGNIEFFAEYERHIDRIAVVGDERWRTDVLLFLAADQRHGEVRYFPANDQLAARNWLAEPDREAVSSQTKKERSCHVPS